MTPALAALYGAVFVLGPVAVWLMARAAPGAAIVRLLGLVVVLLTGAAMLAQVMVPGVLALALLWAAWVVSMGLLVQVLRLVIGAGASRKWTAVAGAVGATVPWFGILVARMVAN
ncbi:MAG: hypothetical protein NXH82_15265 [Rhodobacteraceae bacterium]|nr:hypothetical protein [Paracoccaceae bacterium]